LSVEAVKVYINQSVPFSTRTGEGLLSPEEKASVEVPPSGEKVDFSTLLLSLFSSALIQMGEMPDPGTGEKAAHLDEARHSIEILDILAEKTRGNLTRDEEDLLRQAVTSVKMKYVQAVQEKK
jgi:hypothetical protein